MIYVTCYIGIISVYNPIQFVETVSKSNFILILLYLRMRMLMHWFTFK